MIILFGLKNCDRCRAARTWLSGEGVAYQFVDLRDHGVSEDQMDRWIDALGWEHLLNKRSTTWRGLAPAEQGELDGERARHLMLAHPALIKRPIWDLGAQILVGFDDAVKAVIRAGGEQK
ncbi:arsenate reductase [Iodidimonas nitroreducens]|uniref:Arsenate reductase n=1 Tax=Iodidimonas nitroreducens TaxID=1236968 RepID=A0A5A7N7Q9_9PROT|nr:Spx/MgsR family RNA polymerase-binding regulatory protein [Iodidimonas nitroreducens]GAK33626.1 protein YffB [alpha proteobacterium Q-1]GER03675.1 arsenate reductase [Iodidimonas nitroreducens]